MENVLGIKNFNIIEDEENYYFIRALNMADNEDIENGTVLDENGNIARIRTDRERYEENPENKAPKYSKDAQISLEQVYDHIKMHYRKDTNCISLSSNGNVSISYGRGNYKDRYIMVRVPKRELGQKTINAGQYMLEEVEKRINEYISSINPDSKLQETLSEIDNSKTEKELKRAIETRYTSAEPIEPSKAKLRKGITYRAPIARISSYQALNEEQSLEKNKIIAKLTLLERIGGMKPVIPHTANNNLLVQTIGNAFSSLEVIHYGDIEQDEIIDVPKEIVDIIALLQQVDGQELELLQNSGMQGIETSQQITRQEFAEQAEEQRKNLVRDLKREVINFASSGRRIISADTRDRIVAENDAKVSRNIANREISDEENGAVASTKSNIEITADSILEREYSLRDNISIEEMYNLTDGKVEYGQANSIVKNLFYLARSQSNAKELARILEQITGDNPKYREIIQYISDNGFRIEPEILTRQSNRGIKLSESISLDLKGAETELIEKIKDLTEAEQIEIMENGGLSNVRDIMSSTFSKTQRNEQISKEEYYAEAIFSLYDWSKIGIEEFTPAERNNLINRIQAEHCVELYQKLEAQGIARENIPTILLNMVTRSNDFEITETDTPETIKAKRLEQYNRMIVEYVNSIGENNGQAGNRNNARNTRDKNEENTSNNGQMQSESIYEQALSIERIERFLGYYDVQGTGIQLRPYQQRAKDRADEILQENRFASIILPTGGGKSFVALSQMMEHQNEEMLYLAPQNEILEQMKDNIIKYIHGPVNTIRRSKDDIIKDVFPKLKFATYSSLLARGGKATINKQYGFVVLDELHRTGAKEWGDKLNTLLDNQPESTKVLGITATPRRDTDGINMANEIAQRLGYTNSEAVSGKHIAMNMSLTNAIRMGLVVNPKLVSCAYSLKTDGSLDELKDKIDQIEDVQDRNEKLEEYESLRRNVENAEGIPQILQTNVKKGEKYIVFLPVVEDLEDEDGNVIGRKKGRTKITDYEKQIEEYFKDSDIIPHFNSMLGEYGDKENARRLEEFQNSNTEATEFMLVMNKANEGLHLEKLDGIIWLRPLDENSRILYLQQLGRVIYSENPDRPTKDEDRPVVIDLVNNTIKVNWDNEITEQSDIQMLNLIVDWAERHDGVLPDINSTDKEENGYARILKEIQSKYKEYLENGFDEEELEQKQVEEIKEIIRLGSQIDLWQIELPDRIAKSGETRERSLTDKNVGPFELTGLLKDFVVLEDEVDESEYKTAVERFIGTLKQLQTIGVDASKMSSRDTIETLAKKSGISREKVEEIGLDPAEKIGSKRNRIAQAYRGNKDGKRPTKEQVEEIANLGISLEIQERDTVQEFIDKIAVLQIIGVDASNMSSRDTIETLAKKSGISREKVEEIGLDPAEKIGRKKDYIVQVYRENGEGKRPTKEQVEEIAKLGISLEERNISQEFIDALKTLQTIGVDVSKMSKSDTIETLAKKSGISREKVGEIGLDPAEKIGRKRDTIVQVYRGNGEGKRPTKEQVEEIAKLGISLEERNISQEFIDALKTLQTIGVDVSKMSRSDTIETLAKKSGISREKVGEIGLDPAEKIGKKRDNIVQVYRGNGEGKCPTKKQVEELVKLGISLEIQERDTVQEFIDKIAVLQTIGVDASNMSSSDTIETLAKKSGISKEKVEEIGLDPAEKIGRKKDTIVQGYRGKGRHKRPTKKQVEELAKLGISLERKGGRKEITGKDIAGATIGYSLTNSEMADTEDAALKTLVIEQEEQKRGVDIVEQP